jgi:hypothetical protein
MVEWTKLLAERDRLAFVTVSLTATGQCACDNPGEENTFKFYQMDARPPPAL